MNHPSSTAASARRKGLLLAVAVASTALVTAPSAALAAPAATPRTDIARAVHLVSKIRPSHFARGQRRAVLAAGMAAVRLLHRRHSACGVLAGADRLLARLELPTTWAHRRVPARVVRAPAGLLRAAEKRLIRQAGPRCAAPAKTTKAIRPLKGGTGFTPLPRPAQEHEQAAEPRVPVGRFRPLKVPGPPLALGSGPFQGGPSTGSPAGRGRAGGARAPAGPGQLAFFRFADVGIPGCCDSPQEPTAAIGGKVVWYTGNADVALSVNAGRTFTMFDPSTLLPDAGLPFCCDQLVSYSPQYNIFVWVMQYWCKAIVPPLTNDCHPGTRANRVRIAVASPQALIAHAADPGLAWTYWNLTPQMFGQPPTAWFDRSDLSVNIWNANWTATIVRGNPGVNELLARISLQQLARRGTITIGYITDPQAKTINAQGTQTTSYYLATNSDTQERIWSWEAFSGTLFRHDINHTQIPAFNSAMPGSDGHNWYDRFGTFAGSVESATVSGSTLYVAQGTGRSYCAANCSSPNPTYGRQVFAQPAVFISRYDVNSWKLVGERWLWNPTYGLTWPALQTDGAGDVGIVLRAAPAGQNAQPVAGFLTPSEQFVLALPADQPYQTGDYYSLRPGRTPRSFVMTAETEQNDDNIAPNMHWQYIEYGLGPPPSAAPPAVTITSPADGASYTQGSSVIYSAQVTDPVDGTPPSAAIVWREDGTKIGTGPEIINAENALGVHAITVTATNAEGKSATASITIQVTSPPGPIVANITSPPNGTQVIVQNQVTDSNGNYCGPVSFTATASGGAGPLSYTWTDTITGNINSGPTVVSTDLSPTLTLCAGPFANNGGSTHSLELSVTDGVTITTAFVTIDVITPLLT